jgi:hypothetical protein
MRRIETQAMIDRRKKRNLIIVSVVLIGLLVFAPIGYSLFSGDDEDSEDKLTFNGFEFVNARGYWNLAIQDQIFSFKHSPDEVENVSVSGFYNLGNYSGQVLYLVGLKKNTPSGQEVLNNVGRYILRWQEACLNVSNAVGLECEGDLPVKNCDNNLIIFTEGESEEVWTENRCVYVSGGTRSTDAFLYRLFGIN